MYITPNTTQSPQHLRIFLASPGDVADERALAVRVLNGLPSDPLLRGKLMLEAVAWDHPDTKTPFLAGMSAQDSVIRSLGKPSGCDIVVVILWSRLGSSIEQKQYLKPDGSGYFSGTEWEYEDAWQAYRKHGKPLILFYHRTSIPDVPLDPLKQEEILDRLNQMKSVATFLEACHQRDGSIPNKYQMPSEFEENLRNHLKEQIRNILERREVPQQVSVATLPPTWPGSPFPGLRAFTPTDAPIFFGRGRETDGLVSRLDNPTVRFLTVIGASGSGKSSLVAAGLIPRLMAGAIAGSKDWVWVRFTPGEVSDNPFMALALSFKETLQPQGKQPRELADKLEKHPAWLVELRELVLAGKPAWAELLLFIDQFEELFTLVAPHYVGLFVEWLHQAAQTERIRVVATLRADFYHRCVEWPALAELLRTDSYPLATPGSAALHEMITRPAERAGLTFEKGLAERILDDTGTEPGALALLAFALAELYNARTAEDSLTWAAYHGFQGVKGAIVQRAETTMSRLDIVPPMMGEVFQELVEIGEDGAVMRRRAPWVRLVKSAEVERLVTAFVDARLLVASRGEDGQPVVEVAHEALFTAWKTLSDWLDKHREGLKARQDLEEAAKEWLALGKRCSALASGARLKRYWQAINPSALARQFMHASQRRLWIKRGTGGIATAVVFTGAGWLYGIGMAGRLALMLRDTLGFSDFKEPEMILIQGGEFWMGSADDDPEANEDERPRHRVTMKAFELGRCEVTFEEYDRFAQARGLALPNDQGWGRGRQPVINVSWYDAVDYAAWLSRRTGKQYRLPTEAEWEYAARAGTETTRFWGNDPHQACHYANGADESFRKAVIGTGAIHMCVDGQVVTAKVESYKANNFGLYDMLGNVWEWTCSAYEEKYSENKQEQMCINDNYVNSSRVLRGGAWHDGPEWLRAAARGRNSPHDGRYTYGFRLARTFP